MKQEAQEDCSASEEKGLGIRTGDYGLSCAQQVGRLLYFGAGFRISTRENTLKDSIP